MNQKTKDKLAIVMNAFAKVEKKRRDLQEMENKYMEDISQVKKKIEDLRLNKSRVPTRFEPLTMDALEELKGNRRRGRPRKAAQKTIAENDSLSKTALRTKLRKRKSDDDLVEQQPLPKLRKDVTVTKVVHEDTSMKIFSENKTFAQKISMLDPPTSKKSLYEKTNSVLTDVSLSAITKNTTLRPDIAQSLTTTKSVKNKLQTALSEESFEKNNFLKHDQVESLKNTGISYLNKANSTLKNSKQLLSVEDCKDEENLEPINNLQKNNSPIQEMATKVDLAISEIPFIITTNATVINTSPSEEQEVLSEPKPQIRMTRSKMTKSKKGQVESSSSDTSPSEEREVLSVPEPQVRRTKSKKDQVESSSSNTSTSEEQEVLSVPEPQVRMTRSKMAKSKKNQVESSSRSGEDSDTRSDNNFCSEGETGRKKVKDLVKMINEQQARVLISPVKLTKDQEKENLNIGVLRLLDKKERQTPNKDRRGIAIKTTPLQVRNGYVTPNKKPIMFAASATRNKSIMDDAEKKKKEEEAKRKRLKEEEVLRKKQEMIKIKQEELKKKHEEKMLKAAAMREAAEKEKNDFLLRQEKEREERERMARAEVERKKIEEAMKKKMANQMKAAEVETRRLKEEAARLARLKEMEEEQRQQEELRQKQQEENEKNLKLRQEEVRAKEAAKHKVLQQKELIKKQKANIIPLKDKDNYSITEDLAIEDDEYDELEEDSPKKEYPAWAQREERLLQSAIQVNYSMALVKSYFCCPSSSPDLTNIFGKMTMKRIRSSSAVWNDTLPTTSAINNGEEICQI